jgi:hypothetical protein
MLMSLADLLVVLFNGLLALQIAASCLPARVSATTQFPFQATTDAERSAFVNSPVAPATNGEFYQFKWPIRKVAVIGAGVRCVTVLFR